MTEPDLAPIVLATRDEPREVSATRFAAIEAVATGRPIHVIHVVHGSTADPQHHLLYTYEHIDERARQTCALVAERLRNLTSGSVAITTETPRGRTIEQLIARSADAHMVVLQGRGLSRGQRPLTQSTTEALAGRVASLVVTVPAAWHPYPPPIRRVVVGTGHRVGPTRLLDEALRIADEHHVPLLVVHALDHNGEELADPADQRGRSPKHARAELELCLEPLRRRYPNVSVGLEIASGPPHDALLEAADPHDLLVVGRRDAARPAYEHLGSVSRHILRATVVPLVVVPRPMDTAVLRPPSKHTQPQS